MKPDFTSPCTTPPKPLGVFTLGVPRGIGEFVDGIRVESWHPGPPGSVSSLFSCHGDRLPLASETPPGPEAPHPEFSLLLRHSQRQGRPRRAGSERRRERERVRASSSGRPEQGAEGGEGRGPDRAPQPWSAAGIQSRSVHSTGGYPPLSLGPPSRQPRLVTWWEDTGRSRPIAGC